MPCLYFYRPKWFWTNPNYFALVQVQKLLFSAEFCSCPKHRPKKFKLVKSCFGPIQGQGTIVLIYILCNWVVTHYIINKRFWHA